MKISNFFKNLPKSFCWSLQRLLLWGRSLRYIAFYSYIPSRISVLSIIDICCTNKKKHRWKWFKITVSVRLYIHLKH